MLDKPRFLMTEVALQPPLSRKLKGLFIFLKVLFLTIIGGGTSACLCTTLWSQLSLDTTVASNNQAFERSALNLLSHLAGHLSMGFLGPY